MMMKPRNFALTALTLFLTFPAYAVGPQSAADEDVSVELVPHKALYDIDLVATHSGSQILNITGKMFYEWKPSCEAWLTDHRFSLFYEYADSPGMRITSDFTTFEQYDEPKFNFSSRRKRDGDLYQELRGYAKSGKGESEAIYSMPEGLSYDLRPDTLFPMGHTIEMVKNAKAGKKIFSSSVFDGSDEEGPVEINTFIGKPANALAVVDPSDDLDMTLINTPAWNVRMAVFPENEPEASADYEMSMVFHENGVISDMLIEYEDFSVTQKLIAIEKLEGESCKDSE